VLDIEPANPVVRLAHLDVLTNLMDPAVFPLGERLLQDALDAGNDRLAAEVRMALAYNTTRFHGPTPTTIRHEQEALRTAQRHPGDEWAVGIVNTAGCNAIVRGDENTARALFEHVALASGPTGDCLRRFNAHFNLALVAELSGELVEARNRFERLLTDGLAVSEPQIVDACTSAATMNGALGCLAAALNHAGQARAWLPRLQRDKAMPAAVCDLCTLYAEVGCLPAIDELLTGSAHLLGATTGLEWAQAQVARAQRAVCRAESDEAARLMQEVIDWALPAGQVVAVTNTSPLLLHNEMQAGRHAEAERKADAMAAALGAKTLWQLTGMRWHARALRAHGEGDVAGARGFLDRALEALRPSRWSALARLDAAWLALDDGDLDTAAAHLRRCFQWPDEHPAGMAVKARLEACRGTAAAGPPAAAALPGLPSVQRYRVAPPGGDACPTQGVAGRAVGAS
jgi:tetratricopeptide (TPR) repeat protein